jgi:hypothetical protein
MSALRRSLEVSDSVEGDPGPCPRPPSTPFQRLLNGEVERPRREYALGRRRLDAPARHQGVAIPVVARMGKRHGLEAGLNRTRDYLDIRGAGELWPAIFNRESGPAFEKGISWKTREIGRATVHLAGR